MGRPFPQAAGGSKVKIGRKGGKPKLSLKGDMPKGATKKKYGK